MNNHEQPKCALRIPDFRNVGLEKNAARESLGAHLQYRKTAELFVNRHYFFAIQSKSRGFVSVS